MKFTLTLMLTLTFLLPISASAQSGEHMLTGQDRLLLRVLRWDPKRDLYIDMDGLSGEYTISTKGRLLLPLLGPVQTANKTALDLAQELTDAFENLLGLNPPPRIGVEVIGHQPIYMLGAVASPGAYPYSPGLTAQQALALSGGLLRVPLDQATSSVVDVMRLGGEIRLYAQEIQANEAEQQRLLVDLADLAGDKNDIPADLAHLQNREGDILLAARAARKAQGDSIRTLQTVLAEQIERLTTQIELRARQIVTTQEDLEGVTSLKERGLAVNARVSALTTALNNLEANRLQLEIARLTARQQLNGAQRDELTLIDDARAQTLTRLRRISRDISALQIRLGTARALRAEALATGVDIPDPLGETLTVFRVTRLSGSETITVDLTPTDTLRPGDTIEILRVAEEVDVLSPLMKTAKDQ